MALLGLLFILLAVGCGVAAYFLGTPVIFFKDKAGCPSACPGDDKNCCSLWDDVGNGGIGFCRRGTKDDSGNCTPKNELLPAGLAVGTVVLLLVGLVVLLIPGSTSSSGSNLNLRLS